MTAELVLMNRAAVVLAADSASTVETRLAQKTYNSASKLIPIRQHPPIGAMVFGDANLFSVPWEALLGMYRAQTEPGRKFDKVDDVASDFFAWLVETSRSLFADHERHRVIAHSRSISEELKQRLQVHAAKVGLNDETATDLLLDHSEAVSNDYLQEAMRQLEEQEWLGGTTDINHEVTALVDYHQPQLRDELAIALRTGLGDSLADRVQDTLQRVVAARILLSTAGRSSGLAFAGVPSTSAYPAVAVYMVEGFLRGQPNFKRDHDRSREITASRPAVALPLAQADPVRAFLEGIDPEIRNELRENLRSAGDNITARALGALQSKGASVGADAATQLRVEILRGFGFFGNAVQALRQARERRILEMLAVLPKAELATTAEALVSLAALDQRIGQEHASVSGPFDVAVISKGDGFVWVRRKLYYSMEINPHFAERFG